MVGHRYVILTLKAPASFVFRAGQYTQVEFSDLDGRFQKYYSIASAPRQDHSFDLCLLVGDTRVWQWLRNQNLGQVVRVAPAGGNFHVPAIEKNVVMLGGGSGVTPLKAMLEARSQSPSCGETILLYGCQNDAEIPFYHELLAQVGLQPRTQVEFYAEEVLWRRAKAGRPLDRLSSLAPQYQTADYLLCGPPGMMAAAQELLEGIGIAASQIHRDRF